MFSYEIWKKVENFMKKSKGETFLTSCQLRRVRERKRNKKKRKNSKTVAKVAIEYFNNYVRRRRGRGAKQLQDDNDEESMLASTSERGKTYQIILISLIIH
jgi:hypothetical protein